MRIQNNIMAINSYRNYSNNTSALAKNLEKLSSGYRINRAGDDAAGLAISEKMRAQITGLDAAQKNVKDGISLVKTAEGAMQEIQDMLNRVKYLATQSANGTYQDAVDREALQDELSALTNEIDRIARSADFNGQKLLDGSLHEGAVAGGTFTLGAATTGQNGTVTGDATAAVNDTFTAPQDNQTISVDGFTIIFRTSATADNEIAIAAASTASDARNAVAEKLNELATKAAQKSARSDQTYTEYSNYTIATDGTITRDTQEHTFVPGTGAALTLQIGDNAKDYNQISIDVRSMRSADLGVSNLDISTQEAAQAAIDSVVDIINTVSATRGQLGAIQNRLEHTQNNLSVMSENIQDAESSIRDTDIAQEMMEYTKNNILIQSAQAMLAQANAVPQGVLQLLQ